MDRRTFIAALAALPAGSRASGLSSPPFDSLETVALWPWLPPGAGNILPALHVAEQSPTPGAFHDRIVTGIAHPALYVLRPHHPDGSALLIVPGGGYRELWIDKEGFDIANRFRAAGITAFVLAYRLPRECWQDARDVPLQDAQRAMRLIRAHAAGYGIDPARCGVIGFSAGGHLAASLATRSSAIVYDARDRADALSARPDFAALLYPVVTLLPPYAHEASREMLLGDHPSTALRAAYSCERLVSRDTPPMFLVDALDDPFVPPENTLAMLASLRAFRVAAELHLFERGGHSFGIRGTRGLPVAAWPDLFLNWGRSRGYFRNV